LSHPPERSGRAVHEEADGLDIGGHTHIDGLFFCATLTGRRKGHTPFVQAGAETPDTDAEAVEPDPHCSWEDHSGSECRCGDENTESCGVDCSPHIPLVIRPTARWALSGADVQTPWHGISGLSALLVRL